MNISKEEKELFRNLLDALVSMTPLEEDEQSLVNKLYEWLNHND